MITETAPAKINLYLHVGPARADGLHALASLFVFTEQGDRIIVCRDEGLSLAVEGPFAKDLEGTAKEENLVWRAATRLRAHVRGEDGAAIVLEKNLPVASGVGGGSADAAAALRALMRLWDVSMAPSALSVLAFSLGADVPACLSRRPLVVTGAGETIEPSPNAPALWACLVNPGVETPTGPVFQAFDRANPAPPAPRPARVDATDPAGFAAQLARTRNDLEPVARAMAPEIGDVSAFLTQTPGALLVRMSGSGATVFALYAAQDEAREAAARARTEKNWWALPSKLCSR